MTPTQTAGTRKPLDVSDLIGVPYLNNGRDIVNGLDCYGLVIEVEKRLGKELIDVYYDNHNEELADEYAPLLNVTEVDSIYTGVIIEMRKNGLLHLGVALDKNTMIHATTNQGVRISRVGCMPVIHLYEVNKYYGVNKRLRYSK